METRIARILEDKGSHVHAIAPDATVVEAVERMNEHGIGALLVMDGDKPKGMFTERDVLRRVVSPSTDPRKTKVSDVMTHEVVVVSPDITVKEAMSVITSKRCRHLPVMRDGRVVGLISSGDLTKWVTRNQAQDIQDLVEYINGPHVHDTSPPAP